MSDSQQKAEPDDQGARTGSIRQVPWGWTIDVLNNSGVIVLTGGIYPSADAAQSALDKMFSKGN